MDQYLPFLEQAIDTILDQLGLPFQHQISVAGDDDRTYLLIDLHGDQLGSLIGYHGQVLNSLQFLLTLALRAKAGEPIRVIVDVNDYRKERKEYLVRLAHRTADRVRFLQSPITLSAMPPFERYIIHEALSEDSSVTTGSVGEGRERRVVIRPSEVES